VAEVPFAFQSHLDFAVLIKHYPQRPLRPGPTTNIEKLPIFGDCDEDRISTSHIELFNLTVRMTLRRLTRLTNAHQQEPEASYRYAGALHGVV
jgi:hypothetical protein